MNILILGASGMLGNAVFKSLYEFNGMSVYGTVRSDSALNFFNNSQKTNIINNIDVLKDGDLDLVFNKIKPDIVINCVGIIKQLSESYDPLLVIPVNSLLPHRLARMCNLSNIRLIHMSTDCVFSGKKGDYVEGDQPDASDLYGRSKFLGEVDYPGCITIRTSIIGHELNSTNSLIDWFLSQSGIVKGYKNAIFSGLPTNEMARVIRDYVIPNPSLSGLYHVSVHSISKYDLLQLVKYVYGKIIEIVPDDIVKIDRSLNSKKFSEATGFEPKPWPLLVKEMYEFGRLN